MLLHLQRDYRFNVKLAIASPSWFTRCHPQNELVAISHPAKCQKLPRSGKLLIVFSGAAANVPHCFKIALIVPETCCCLQLFNLQGFFFHCEESFLTKVRFSQSLLILKCVLLGLNNVIPKANLGVIQ